jgi:formylglycine-generating enzyme required for sulfatase activity
LGGDAKVGDLKIVCVKRGWPRANSKGQGKAKLKELGFPTNHECQSSLPRLIYNNEIGIIDISSGEYETLYKPKGRRFVGHINLHWNGEKLLFTQSDEDNWEIFEINIDGTGLRQVSKTPDDVDSFEACYLPDGRIIFNSNAGFQCVPCWHGEQQKFVANLFIMNGDGTGMRRVTFDQDHDFHPFVRHNGQVVYSRWDYTGINRLFLRPVMVMNPDGTGQRAIYGSNSWFPNGLYYPKELPGRDGVFLCVMAGYHGSYRSGMLVLVDINKGSQEADGIVQRISGLGKEVEVKYKDRLTEDNWPEFMTPSPVTDELFLVSAWKNAKDGKIGIYLADTSDNVKVLHEEEGFAFLEPVPIVKRKMPPAIPDRVNTERSDAIAFIQDIYAGPGLKDVPRGTVKRLRVIAYDFGYVGLAGMDKIGLTGPWEAMRILGTTPVEADGSAIFRIPANTSIAFQPLDAEGKAVQLMRSWVTAMPGEIMSCVGCHENAPDVPQAKVTIASERVPRELEPWYGPARGFDFEREVQPVLNRYCVRCHDQDHKIDLRGEKLVTDYKGRIPGRLDFTRLHPVHKEKFDSKVFYTPAYEALLPYIRRVNVSDDVSMLEPGEYHADTSELIQHLKEGHKGIRLDEESWSRLVTWIDLNGPCHGTWEDVYSMPVPDKVSERRLELAKLYGGPAVKPNVIPAAFKYDEEPVKFKMPPKPKSPVKKAASAPRGLEYRSIDLGGGEKIRLVKFDESYWMSTCEISNAQFRQFDPGHSSRYYGKRHADRGDDKGLPLDEPEQPAVRVSWNRAMAFCGWLSKKTGLDVTLPTEEQWEAGCLAGGSGSFHYPGKDFSQWENMADKTFATFGYTGKTLNGYFQVGGDNDLIAAEGVDLADVRFDDKGCATVACGSYRPNAFGLHDMHGNAAEWTLSDFGGGEKTVKGGSFLDRPARCSVNKRHGYPAWQNVYNVGFRVVCGIK